MVTQEGRSYQDKIGPASESPDSKFFDIIGFDPRGVGNTAPSFSCFPNHIQRSLFDLESAASGVVGSSETAFDNAWARYRGMADYCSRANGSDIRNHMSTVYVTRDIVEIFERHGEWRENEARKLLETHLGKHQSVLDTGPEIPDHLKWKPGKEMIQFWGFSYGTVLGATLAAMYPKRIQRMVLDGNVDSFDWYEGGEKSAVQDADLIIDRFGELCFAAGPDCALFDASGPMAIRQKFFKIIDNLKSNPFNIDHHLPDALVTYVDLEDVIQDALYDPLQHFPTLADTMVQVENRDGYDFMREKVRTVKNLESGIAKCERYKTCSWSLKTSMDDSFLAVLCTDAQPQIDLSKEEFKARIRTLTAQSKVSGGSFGEDRISCTQWHARPKWRYDGDFNVTTAVPIMFIGNTADPVTPLRNAFNMSRSFSGSVVLTQDSEGHCSESSPSFCTSRAVRSYFQSGKLPKNSTVCSPDRKPFDGFHKEDEPPLPVGESDEVLWKAMVNLSRLPRARRHRGRRDVFA